MWHGRPEVACDTQMIICITIISIIMMMIIIIITIIIIRSHFGPTLNEHR